MGRGGMQLGGRELFYGRRKPPPARHGSDGWFIEQASRRGHSSLVLFERPLSGGDQSVGIAVEQTDFVVFHQGSSVTLAETVFGSLQAARQELERWLKPQAAPSRDQIAAMLDADG